MSNVSDGAVKRQEHEEFVSRFLKGLTNALQVHAGQRATGVTKSIADLGDSPKVSTSQKVVDARMALGADDSLYLQSGLGLLWAGDENMDDEHLLFPASMGAAGNSDGARDAVKATMIKSINEQITTLLKSLEERLPALVYLLSMREVYEHVKGEIESAKMLSPNDETLAVLLQGFAKDWKTENDRSGLATGNGRKIQRWVANVQKDAYGPFFEELILFCASLQGLYLRTGDSDESRSPMELADLYTDAAVDTALTRDWSSAEGVIRAAHADAVGPTVGGGGDPRAQAGATAKQRSKQEAPPARVARGEPVGVTLAGMRAQPDAAYEAPSAKRVRIHEPDGGVWMAGLLGLATGVEVGTDDADGDTADESLHEHRFERAQDQKRPFTDADTTGNVGIERLRDMVLTPLGGQMGLSMAMGASPLWNPSLRNMPQDEAALDLEHPLQTLETYTGEKFTPPDLNAVVEHPAFGQIVRSLFAQQGASPYDHYRKLPESGNFMESLRTLSSPDPGDPPPPDPDPNTQDDVSDDEASVYGDALEEPEGAPAPAFPPIAPTRAKKNQGVMRPQGGDEGYSGTGNRFVSYALQRGLTADYGPHEAPLARKDKLLPYSRGVALPPQRRDAPSPLSSELVNVAQLERVPLALYNQWSSRNKEASNLVEALKMLGSLGDPTGVKVDGRPQFLETEVTLSVSSRLRPEINVTGSVDQHLTNTMREVRWAPVGKRMSGGGRDEVIYNDASIAASASATYEHLIATLTDTAQGQKYNDRNQRVRGTPVPQPLRGAMRAALKLHQLPHMLKFNQKLQESDGDMQKAMIEGTKGLKALKLAINGYPTVQGSDLYRTIVPTTRVLKGNVREVTPSALSGVWSVKLRSGLETNLTAIDLIAKTAYKLGTEEPTTKAALDKLGELAKGPEALGEDAIPAPTWGISVPNLPLGFTYASNPDLPLPDFGVSRSDTGNWDTRTEWHDKFALGKHAPCEPERADSHPKWLDSSAKVESLISDCYLLAVRVRELRLQRDAFREQRRDDAPQGGVTRVVERERRGAIWEDALREMSISQVIIQRSPQPTLHPSPFALHPSPFTLHLTRHCDCVGRIASTISYAPCRALFTRTSRRWSRSRYAWGSHHAPAPRRRPQPLHLARAPTRTPSDCAQDHGMDASNRALRDRRHEILKQSSQFQSRLIERVMAGVLKDSKLQFDLASDPNALGERAATELVVINKATVEHVRELAQGTSGIPFFAQNAELERTLGTDLQPMAMADLIQRLQEMAEGVQKGMLDSLNQSSAEGVRSSLEYLSRPRNSYLVRLKPEGFAAIKVAYSIFCTEWRIKFDAGMRRPSAWELVEGVDMHLTSAFAEFAAHKLAHARMFGSSHAGYLGATPAKANAIPLRMALHKLTTRAAEYVQLVAPPDYKAGAKAYRSEKPQDFMVSGTGVSAAGNAYARQFFGRVRGDWGVNMYGSS